MKTDNYLFRANVSVDEVGILTKKTKFGKTATIKVLVATRVGNDELKRTEFKLRPFVSFLYFYGTLWL